VHPLLAAAEVPVFCNVQWATREEARAAPRARLDIRLCHACGHAHNPAFDPDEVAYSPAYDNSQHFSETFRAYARRLVDRLVAEHGLRDAAIVDIGCGRGDLLALFAERGGNRGYGFDPSFQPANDLPLPPNVTIRRTLFAREEAAELRPSLVCCRHVLEHVPDPVAFLREVHAMLAPLRSTVLYLEVPSGDQLLRDRAIWDYIYEHVSYFSARSLRLVFAAAGFEVLRLQEDFGGQFLCAEVRVKRGGHGSADTTTDQAGVPGTAAALRDKLAGWRDWAAATASGGRRATVWGAGSKGVMFLNLLGLSAPGPLDFVIDQNPNKSDRYIAISGQVIRSPAHLVEAPVEEVVVMNSIYRDEIQRQLAGLNVHARVLIA
jgi:SAM-dependent methyltransferase